MTTKPVIPRYQASRDIDAAIDHCLSEDAQPAALGFIDALEHAYRHISLHDVAALRIFCMTQLGCFKCPKVIHFVDDLPRWPSGKVQRLKLPELV